MSTTKRMDEIIAAVTPVQTLVDVGCDHGYIGTRCLQDGLAHSVIFTDISQKCLDKAFKLAEKLDILDNCSFRNCSGVAEIKAFDAGIIAGMGGENIIKILEADIQKFQKSEYILLQPMSNVPQVRKFLCEHNFKITAEHVFNGRRFYHLITAKTGTMSLNAGQIMFGADRNEYARETYLEYLMHEQAKWQARYKINKNAKISHILQILAQHLQFIRS